MTYQRERDQFLLEGQRAGLSYDVCLKLLRYSTTLHRLAEAQCNGDYPADNGERTVVPCSRCESLWVRSSMIADRAAPRDPARPSWIPLICKDCRTQDLVRATLPETLIPEFKGDPRGGILALHPAGTPDADIQSGRSRGIHVPSRY